MMNREKNYNVPEVLDKIYDDVVRGLYSSIQINKYNMACDLLIKSSLSEDDIVSMLEFKNVVEFQELFKDYLGIFPHEFRGRFSNII